MTRTKIAPASASTSASDRRTTPIAFDLHPSPGGGYLHLPSESVQALMAWMQGKGIKSSASSLLPTRLLLGRRLVVQVTFRGLPVLADLLTGVLYDPKSGRCLSSTRLHLDVAKLLEVSPAKAQAWLRQRQKDQQDAKL
ncbi:MAG: hypothetical protein ACYCS8_06550 [Acidithiobacillus sp.]